MACIPRDQRVINKLFKVVIMLIVVTNLSQLVEELGSCSGVLLADLDRFAVLEQSLVHQQVKEIISM